MDLLLYCRIRHDMMYSITILETFLEERVLTEVMLLSMYVLDSTELLQGYWKLFKSVYNM